MIDGHVLVIVFETCVCFGMLFNPGYDRLKIKPAIRVIEGEMFIPAGEFSTVGKMVK